MGTEQLEALNFEDASEPARYTVEEVLAIAEEREIGPEEIQTLVDRPSELMQASRTQTRRKKQKRKTIIQHPHAFLSTADSESISEQESGSLEGGSEVSSTDAPTDDQEGLQSFLSQESEDEDEWVIDPGLQEYQAEHHPEGVHMSVRATDQEDDADDDVEVVRPSKRRKRKRKIKKHGWKGTWETLRTGLLSHHMHSQSWRLWIGKGGAAQNNHSV